MEHSWNCLDGLHFEATGELLETYGMGYPEYGHVLSGPYMLDLPTLLDRWQISAGKTRRD